MICPPCSLPLRAGEAVGGRIRRGDVNRSFHAVFLAWIFLNSLYRVLAPDGSPYSAVRGAIGLKLPSVAIFPWVLKQAVKENTRQKQCMETPIHISPPDTSPYSFASPER